MQKLRHLLRLKNKLLKECLAEFLGTFVLLLFGCSAAAQVKTSHETKGQYLSINMAFAIGVIFAMYISRGVSGAHLNPAVSLSFCMIGRFPWTKVPIYIFFQIFGAYMASATVFALYYDAIMNYSGGNLTVTGSQETASIFATYPSDYLSQANAFFDQIVGTAALLLCILPIEDAHNSPAPKGFEPVLVGFLVLGISMSMSSNCGAAINPARDLGPRLFTWSAGWGTAVFTAFDNWWWIPIVAPMLGGVIGAYIYLLFIEFHHEDSDMVQQIKPLTNQGDITSLANKSSKSGSFENIAVDGEMQMLRIDHDSKEEKPEEWGYHISSRL
ncbi:aquaporin-10-like [Erpetoichthys calabaricus]|nr:aquaporin-10-like [Erpetoichthys calabaricus]